MRTWPGLAAIGAGLVHLGLAAGSPAPLLVALLIPGAAEVAWGVLALARPERARSRAALGVAAAFVALQAAILVGGHAHHGGRSALPAGAVAGAATLDLAVAACLAVGLRRRGGGEPGPLAFVLGTIVGASLVAVVTASSLAGTAIGAHPMTMP